MATTQFNARNGLSVGTTPVSILDASGNASFTSASIAASGGLTIASGAPGVTTNALYQVGSALYWNGSAVGGGSSLPSQTGNAGKFLTTDGSNASWSNNIAKTSAVTFLSSTRSDLANTVTFIHTSANLITCSGSFAATQFNGSGSGLFLGTVAASYTIQDLGTVTATQTPSLSNGRYIRMTLGANIDLILQDGTNSNTTEKLILEIKQDGTGSRTVYIRTHRGFPGGITPTLSTAANAVDIMEFLWTGTNWMLTNFIPNQITATTIAEGLRPSTYTAVSPWVITNPGNVYDTGTSTSVDTSTYATAYVSANSGTVSLTFHGFSGNTKSGTLYVRFSKTGANGSEGSQVNYTKDGGTTWEEPPINSTINDVALTTFSVALTNVNPALLKVRINMGRSFYQATFNIYDIVFI